MLVVPTYLKASAIHGIGVFAGRAIAKGEAVWRFDERFYAVLTDRQIAELPPELKAFCRIYAWPHMKREGLWCLDTDNGRFMNHAEKANTDFRQADAGWAIADIAKDQEITCNYFEFDPNYRFD